MARAAPNATIVAGFPERTDDSQTIYNSAAVIHSGGLQATYRKSHLWDQEKLWFTPGQDAPRVLDTPHGRIGVLICYDLEFPELTRTLALAGAELITVPTNWPVGPHPPGERPAEVIVAMAAAHGNRVFIACCDRAGTERGQEWHQGTSIIDSDGWVVSAQPGIGPAAAEVDLALAREKTYTGLADAFADRRPELYGAVTDLRAD